jgi:hypothetical protein
MKKILISLLFFIGYSIQAQNVGIGTTTPTGPLSFPSILGNKIVLWGDGNASHYGFGIQNALFQIYSDAPAANIGFGFGRSSAFTERMRIINSGGEGLILNGRMTLRNGTNPIDLNYGAGVWMYKPDNSALLGFMGVQNNQNLGFYGGPAGWGFTYDAINSRVGIGNNNPNAPLAFPASLGKKITLYPGTTGDVGFGVAGNRLQIYSDNPNADVAIGYDAAGTFNERFAVKPTGALAINGNTGTSGQVLRSNGAGSPAVWTGSDNAAFQFNCTDWQLDVSDAVPTVNIGGINGQTFTITRTSIVIINCRLMVSNPGNAFGGNAVAILRVSLLNPSATAIGSDGVYQLIGNGDTKNLYCQFMVDNVAPGTYTISTTLTKGAGDGIGTGGFYFNVTGTNPGNLIVQAMAK